MSSVDFHIDLGKFHWLLVRIVVLHVVCCLGKLSWVDYPIDLGKFHWLLARIVGLQVGRCLSFSW